nr:hypothetical protein [Pedobacter sp. ASV19]
MNNLKNIITSLQVTFAIATFITLAIKMNHQIEFISFLMLSTFLFFTFYLISLDRKPAISKYQTSTSQHSVKF